MVKIIQQILTQLKLVEKTKQKVIELTKIPFDDKKTFDLLVGEICLKEGAWVGAKTVVCPNVTIGAYAILTVGSIATKTVKENGIYQGNPAVYIRERKFKKK